LKKRSKKSTTNTISDLLKKLGKGRTYKKFVLPHHLSSMPENNKFDSLLDIYSRCFIFDVYKSLEKVKEPSWHKKASLFQVGEKERARVLIATLKEDLMRRIKNKMKYILNAQTVIPLEEILSRLGDGNGECDNCSLQRYLKNHDAELATELSENYKRRGKCEICKKHIDRKTLAAPYLFFEGDPILVAEGKAVQIVKTLASMKENDSEVMAQLILLHHGNAVEVAIDCTLMRYSLHYGGYSFHAGEIDVLTLKGNTITQIEITKVPYKEKAVREWGRHQQKAYHRHFILKNLGFSVKTFFLFPHIGKKVKIDAKSQVKRQFSFYPILISFNFNKDVEKAKKSLKKLIEEV